ncbi:transmembrane protein 200A [Melanotaenia boesemani]|uniref:transmembrane protein 200A n=1 Tax=Melanotaenia boesemani TaxID=1250792 RepID=UPI001C03C874|nr:transmembrane protein 200A [Melanotaenia boesemani]XP_041868258.1 transmembrane protein 200A [Melanotaenia boesemani]
MKSQKSRGVPPASPSGRRKHRFYLRGRKKKDRVIQGKLRIRSLPGAFFVLGVVVVVVGTAMAVAGYWPYRLSRSSFLGAAEGENVPNSQNPGWNFGAKGLLPPASFLHGERMKLLGPVIMGVGLFILICANTVLYENRDRETQMLLAQMRNVICSVSAAVPSAGLKDMAETNSMIKHYHWVSSIPAAHLNILCLQQLTSSEPLLQTRRCTDQDSIYQQAVLQTDAVHLHESNLPTLSSSSYNNECNQEPSRSSSVPQAAPLLKLMSASSMSTLAGDEVHVPAPRPRRCHSMIYRTSPYISKTAVGLMDGLFTSRKEGEMDQPEINRTTGIQVCVNIPGPVAENMEDQTHRSWPQLDVGSGRRYLKLENKEDSVDRLLDQLEQQSASWDKTFGSGPFQ